MADITDEQIISALREIADESLLRGYQQEVIDAGRALLALQPSASAEPVQEVPVSVLDEDAYVAERVRAEQDQQRGAIAYQLTKRLVIDMPTARAAVDAALNASPPPVTAAREQEARCGTCGGSGTIVTGLGEHAGGDICPTCIGGEASATGAEPTMVAIAKRNLCAYLSKASFASNVDREAALNCVDVLVRAAGGEQSAQGDK